ncbi:MAG TPA: class I SAM-dependent methyltransferase [Anaerolineales bacterium]|nr:class I SAM-dependent methyltransferase [Anaerolineales bacterium]
MSSEITFLASDNWLDYELLDSGEGQKLERFGKYIFVRPEVEALWKKKLPKKDWDEAHGFFQKTREESGGFWKFNKSIPDRWELNYGKLYFWVMPTPGRHLGVFPEGAVHWDWMADLIASESKPVKVLNLFGYTGLATLAAAGAGAMVTHVDASKKSVAWAKENQELSGMQEKPIRWIVDDALKFVQREYRRGSKYQGLIIDPPKFGRGPKGEVWEVYKSLPVLLDACKLIMDKDALFSVLTVYAVKASSFHIKIIMEEMSGGLKETVQSGELGIRESSGGRLLSTAVFARWQSDKK